ncbi:hypothetical protein Tco_0940531 [Tanacetum coccineum]|uniref:Uncharacterized protein n=1 Tax=Tanacetum coccineum TaxID=301880 RepID=A0ABQ5DQX1_9ASTR
MRRIGLLFHGRCKNLMLWDEDDEWLMAPVTPPNGFRHVPSTYEVGGNLEYKHRVLMRKMEAASDLEVASSIAIKEIHPRVATVEGQVQGMASHVVHVVSKLEEMETRVQQVESRVDIHPGGQTAMLREDVIVGLRQQVQTLQTALHGAELQNQ